MKQKLKRTAFLTIGTIFFIVGFIGIIVPILPTTPFMILAAACFAKSSIYFHQMLLNNRWFGKELQYWEAKKAMKRNTKKRATWVVFISFAISINLLWGHTIIQLLLLCTALILLYFLWRIKEDTSSLL